MTQIYSPLYITQTVAETQKTFYKVYYDWNTKKIKCGIIGLLSQDEEKKLSQFGQLEFKDYLIKAHFEARVKGILVFNDGLNLINFFVQYVNSPGFILSIFNEHDSWEQYLNITRSLNQQETEIIFNLLKQSNRFPNWRITEAKAENFEPKLNQ